MNKGLKIFLWVLVILAVVLTSAFFWGKSVWDKITFSDPNLQKLDLKGLTLADLAKIVFEGSSKEVKVTLGMEIKNENSFSIPFSSMSVKMYYKGSLITETSPYLKQQKFVLPANGKVSVSDTINIVLNGAGAQMVLEKIKGGKPSIDYKIGLKVFGIPLPSIENNFTW